MSDSEHSDANELASRSPGERAARYRELADMHLKVAASSKAPEARASHLELAALWTRLAAQADRQAREGGAAEAGNAAVPGGRRS